MKKINNIGIFILTLLLAACGSNDDNSKENKFWPQFGEGISPASKNFKFYYFGGEQQMSVDGDDWAVSAILDTYGNVMSRADDGDCSWDWLTAGKSDDGEYLTVDAGYFEEFDTNRYLIVELARGESIYHITVDQKARDSDDPNLTGEIDGHAGDGGMLGFAAKELDFEAAGGTMIFSVGSDMWCFEGGVMEEDPSIYKEGDWVEYRKIGLARIMVTASKNTSGVSRTLAVFAGWHDGGSHVGVYQKATE